MSEVWKKKDWLKENGFITNVGRGRISGENHARLSEAANSGVKFSDYNPVETVKSVETGKVKVVRSSVTPPAISGKGPILSDIAYRYAENDFKAVADDGTEYNMRAACQNCGLSLCGHRCNNPVVLDKIVRIVPV